MNANEQAFLSLLGYVFLQNARPEKAAVVMAALDALHPGQPQVLRSLALAQLRSNKPAQALATLDKLAMSGAVDAAFHLLRAQALNALKRTDEATVAMQTYTAMRTPPVTPAAPPAAAES